MTRIALKINGKSQAVNVDPACPLLYVLRDDLGLKNPRFGCGLGQCGACTVLVDGRPARSCVLPVTAAKGKAVTTLEGLGTHDKPHAVQAAFIEEQAFQCGYCLNGWVLAASALLERNHNPTDADMKTAFQGLICRCGSHVQIFAAVRRAATAMRKG